MRLSGMEKCVYVFASRKKKKSWSLPTHHPSFTWHSQSFKHLPLTFMQTTENQEWLVAPSSNFCVHVHVCSCLCLRVIFAGTSRDKAPSARSRLSWLPTPLAGAEKRLSVSIVMKLRLLLLLLLRCLLMLTANNVLVDALLKPERRDRD